ncbi:protein mono-ADP-ribosyltransferase PARP16-like [Oscarella lobularis]|uniref:protein mono-ADP-ribosyltransferase PARP16-like n=1 Tax=Oscarella lobularis TaxID=121494 RepID=UPI0033144983
MDRLLAALEDDPSAADFAISAFQSALLSYRHDSILRPFPPQYMQGEERDISSVKSVASRLPSVVDLKKQLRNGTADPDTIDLVSWLLFDCRPSCRLRTAHLSAFKDIQKKTGRSSYAIQPSYVVELLWSESSSLGGEGAGSQFSRLSQTHGTFYAYHGSRVENFHSILRYGLISHLNKNSLFGVGTYLSTDLSVCMPYSPIGQSWTQSELGRLMSCVAICEVVNHPQLKSGRIQARKSEGGEMVDDKVPDKYYIVGNNEFLRVKYVLVFADKDSKKSIKSSNRLFRMMSRHKVGTMIILYMLLLAVIGFLQSTFYMRLSRQLFPS